MDEVLYARLLANYLEKFDQTTRQKINHVLFPEVHEVLDEGQKSIKISSLLTKLRKKASLKIRVLIALLDGVLQGSLQRKNSSCREK